MPVSSPSSRVFLGVVLTIAVVLMVVVACSQPSSSEQNQRLSLAAGDDQAPVAKPPIEPVLEPEASSPSGAPVDSSADVPSPEAKQISEPMPELKSDQQPSPDSVSAPPKDPPAAQPQEAATTDAPAVEQPSAADASATDAAAPQETEPASADESGQSEGDGEKSDSQPKPLQRLSREFARRRAAREGEQPAATEISLPPVEVYQPTVVMSQEHRQSCLVFVGDELPDGLLADAEGEKHAIQQSLAKPLTAVVFWDSTPYALDQFKELAKDLAPFAPQGVRAIAIHVGPAPENYQELCQKYGQDSLCLLDADRTYFAKVAQEKLPRTYLLDAEGKIVWLDIEYSRTTRYELRNALLFCLQKKK